MEAVTEKEERGAESVQRRTAKRRSALVLSILRGETSAQEAARKHGLTVAEIEGWQERYLLAAENALRSRPRNEEALKDEQIKKLKQKIGDLVTDVDILKEAMKPYRPYAAGDVRRVNEAIPGASHRRICRVLEVARSAMTSRIPKRRTRVIDEVLAERIHELIGR